MKQTLRNITLSTLLALAVYVFIFYSETRSFPNFIEQRIGIIIAVALVNLVGATIVLLNSVFNKYIKWDKNNTLRFIIEITSGVILTTMAAIVFIYAFVAQVYTNTDIAFVDFIYDGLIKFSIISIVIIYVYSIVNFSIFSYNQYSVGQIEALKNDRIQLDLRFEALKSQLNPHFLFNALNTISSLIYMDINQAEKYIRQLANTYDYILETDETQIVPFQEELKMVKGYFFMLKIKYEDRVDLKINENTEHIGGYLPPFVLQILVENALKHSVISEENPLLVEIYADSKEELIIRNNIVEKPELLSSMSYLANKQKDSESYKIGLSNIRNRYVFLTNKTIEIISDTHFTVKIPIIQCAND